MTNLAPHRSVDLYLECNLSSVRVRKLVKPQPIPTQGIVIGPAHEATGWDEVTRALRTIKEAEKTGALEGKVLEEVINCVSHQFADMAEEEIISATGVAPRFTGQRNRKAHVGLKPLLQPKPAGPIAMSTAAKWAKKVVSDIRVKLKDSSYDVKSMLYGKEKAAETVSGDEDLSAIIAMGIRLGESWRDITEAEADSSATNLGTILRDAVDCLNEKEKRDSIDRWKKWLKEDSDKGSGRAHAYSKIPQAWVARETRDKDQVLTGDPCELPNSERERLKKLWEGREGLDGDGVPSSRLPGREKAI